MPDRFLPFIPLDRLKEVQASNDMNEYYDLLCQPLHEELYRRQDFTFFEELSEGQQLLVCYDYVQNHVLQGGFIQLIQNGYVNMLAPMPGWLATIGDEQMAKLMDDALKAYVINRDILDKETTPEEFANLYEQLPVFGPLDKRFESLHPYTVELMLQYATHHIEEFAKVIG
jgi:hypothetical protein